MKYMLAVAFTALAGASIASATGTPLPPEDRAYCMKAKAKDKCEATRKLVASLKSKQPAKWSEAIAWDYVKDDESDMVFEFWLNERTKTA